MCEREEVEKERDLAGCSVGVDDLTGVLAGAELVGDGRGLLAAVVVDQAEDVIELVPGDGGSLDWVSDDLAGSLACV